MRCHSAQYGHWKSLTSMIHNGAAESPSIRLRSASIRKVSAWVTGLAETVVADARCDDSGDLVHAWPTTNEVINNMDDERRVFTEVSVGVEMEMGKWGRYTAAVHYLSSVVTNSP